MSNIEISKINIDETQLLIKDAQNRQDLASLSTEVQSISTDLTSLSTSISTNLNSLSTEVQSISTNLNSLSTSISTNYLPLSGGTMIGSIKLASAGLETYSPNGYIIDQYGNFIHKIDNISDYWALQDSTTNTNNKTVKIYFDTGNISTNGTITLEQSGVSYIQGVGGKAGLYAKKPALNSDKYIIGLVIQTESGGGWAIGNYKNENLMFSYGTKANIDAETNTVSTFTIDTNGNYSGKAANVTGTVAIANGGTGQSGIIKVVGTTTSGVTKGIINIYKWGKFVNIIADPVIYLATAVGAEESAAIGTIPSGYRPKHAIRDVGGSYNNKGDILISTAGAISFTGNGTAKAAIHNIYFNITYVID